ncbi:hypothetical protein [Foetidibacter luteolus]|uniref:hypothetical protein n=1 Tax=Foetidibacter luteolus TaxID=2608880 RepID=UPI00129A7DE4|nr:hypothetical protein [Foetidibacter luteolus]
MSKTNDIQLINIANRHLQISISPANGGRVTSLYNKRMQREFLWTNPTLPLAINQEGDEYDPNFFGGIDELIPNDLPETIDGIAYPDHGELWTTALNHEISGEQVTVSGQLRLSGLFYSKTVYLDEQSPIVHLRYKIKNYSGEPRHFLWKLHAALTISEGAKVVSKARHGQVVDTAYSRFSHTEKFSWPNIENTNAAIIPAKNGTMDFFYLFDEETGKMQLQSADNTALFSYEYDPQIFPYQWYFASYGGFLDHYTAILEPCTSMPISVNDAAKLNQCTVLQPGEQLETSVRIFAGRVNDPISIL